MKLAYVNNHYQLGGAETVVRQLHEGALHAGHDSRLHVTDGKSWPQAPGLAPLYPRWLARLDHSRWHKWVRHFAPRRAWTDRAFRNLAVGDADLVHVHSFHGLYASLESLAVVARAKPLVWTFHRFWGITGGCDHPFDCTRYQTGCGRCPQVGRFAVGPVDRTADEWHHKKGVLSPLPLEIVAPSRHLAARVRASNLGRNWRVHIIPNGVDPGTFSARRKGDPAFKTSLGLAPGKTTALFVCRDFKDPIKGFPAIRQALNSTPWPDLQIALAGENSAWACAQLAPEINAADLGYVRDRSRLAALFEASEIFLYASDGENFPCVVIEAMAAGCCIVTAPVDGVAEQIEDGVSGYAATDKSPDAFAALLQRISALPQSARKATGHAARTRVETEFSEQIMIDRHLALYADIARDFRRTA